MLKNKPYLVTYNTVAVEGEPAREDSYIETSCHNKEAAKARFKAAGPGKLVSIRRLAPDEHAEMEAKADERLENEDIAAESGSYQIPTTDSPNRAKDAGIPVIETPEQLDKLIDDIHAAVGVERPTKSSPELGMPYGQAGSFAADVFGPLFDRISDSVEQMEDAGIQCAPYAASLDRLADAVTASLERPADEKIEVLVGDLRGLADTFDKLSNKLSEQDADRAWDEQDDGPNPRPMDYKLRKAYIIVGGKRGDGVMIGSHLEPIEEGFIEADLFTRKDARKVVRGLNKRLKRSYHVRAICVGRMRVYR